MEQVTGGLATVFFGYLEGKEKIGKEVEDADAVIHPDTKKILTQFGVEYSKSIFSELLVKLRNDEKTQQGRALRDIVELTAASSGSPR